MERAPSLFRPRSRNTRCSLTSWQAFLAPRTHSESFDYPSFQTPLSCGYYYGSSTGEDAEFSNLRFRFHNSMMNGLRAFRVAQRAWPELALRQLLSRRKPREISHLVLAGHAKQLLPVEERRRRRTQNWTEGLVSRRAVCAPPPPRGSGIGHVRNRERIESAVGKVARKGRRRCVLSTIALSAVGGANRRVNLSLVDK